jgi:hypothetical protein
MVVVGEVSPFLKIDERVGQIIDRGIVERGDEIPDPSRRLISPRDPLANRLDLTMPKRTNEPQSMFSGRVRKKVFNSAKTDLVVKRVVRARDCATQPDRSGPPLTLVMVGEAARSL